MTGRPGGLGAGAFGVRRLDAAFASAGPGRRQSQGPRNEAPIIKSEADLPSLWVWGDRLAAGRDT